MSSYMASGECTTPTPPSVCSTAPCGCGTETQPLRAGKSARELHISNMRCAVTWLAVAQDLVQGQPLHALAGTSCAQHVCRQARQRTALCDKPYRLT